MINILISTQDLLWHELRLGVSPVFPRRVDVEVKTIEIKAQQNEKIIKTFCGP